MSNAAYVVVEADSFDLAFHGDDIDVDHTISFSTSSDVDDGRESVLTFDVNPGNGDAVSVQWSLNNKDILKQTFDLGKDARAWQAVVPKNLLKAQDNKLTARLIDENHKGSINFGDIVLWYTRKS
jgi:hypothetical protein